MGFKIERITKLILAVCVICVTLSCEKKEYSYIETEFALGTYCSITLFEKGTDKVFNDVFKRIREIENLMSVNIRASDISRINAAAGLEAVTVHPDVFKVIERAVFFAELSSGAFDPTVEPLVALWGINSASPKVPSREEIDEAINLINWRDIELDANTQSVFLKRHGMSLDLGAIAKGYAADEVFEIIKSAEIKRAVIDLGGNIVLAGENKDRPWKIGIQNPFGEVRGIALGILQIPSLSPDQEMTIVTSGVYERSFEADGISYHHIFSPATGFPADNGLLSVTIITHNSMNADALSTAVFVLGFEKGVELVNDLPGVEAVFVFDDKTVRKTDGADFTIIDDSFKLIN